MLYNVATRKHSLQLLPLDPKAFTIYAQSVSISMVPITMAAEQHSSWNNQVITLGHCLLKLCSSVNKWDTFCLFLRSHKTPLE